MYPTSWNAYLFGIPNWRVQTKSYWGWVNKNQRSLLSTGSYFPSFIEYHQCFAMLIISNVVIQLYMHFRYMLNTTYKKSILNSSVGKQGRRFFPYILSEYFIYLRSKHVVI